MVTSSYCIAHLVAEVCLAESARSDSVMVRSEAELCA